MKPLFFIIFILPWLFSKGQVITPQVINTIGGGGLVGTTGVEVYYSVGETFITTINNNNNILTQGFIQPRLIGEFGLVASAFITPNSCSDKADGEIKIEAKVENAFNQTNFAISYYFTPAATSCTAANTCSVSSNLAAGTYSVIVVSHYIGGANAIPDDSVLIKNLVVSGSTEPCQINVFNGISPNGDGNNDFFTIENIEQFADNKVVIYNRWGDKLFETNHYDNKVNVWKGTANGSGTVTAGTYFYIITLGNGTAPIKGWLELTGQ